MHTPTFMQEKMAKMLVWSVLLLNALVLVLAGAHVEEYWERKLPAAMPSSIRAMLTPLHPQETAQLVIQSSLLPRDAATFCKAARMKCGRGTPSLKSLSYQNGKNPVPSSKSEAMDDAEAQNTISFYHSEAEAQNSISFYHSEAEAQNTISFYHSEAKTASPHYHSEAYNHSEAEAQNTISFYHSEAHEPSAKNHVPSMDPQYLLLPNVHEIRNVFREKQVLQVTGQKLYIDFAHDRREADERAFLPRRLAKRFPFDNKGSKIGSMLGIPRRALEETIYHCEAKSENDFKHAEVKACLTSLEDVVDFVTGIMGSSKPMKVYDSLTNATTLKYVGKLFTVRHVEALKRDPDEPSVACHDMAFPFRVFFCHFAKQTRSFAVTLQDEEGGLHQRLVNCHYDTSYWNPRHVAFQELHTTPGDGEVCHWLGMTWMEENGWLFLHA